MSPETHLLASWLIASKTTCNPRDCRLVALAEILPDLDGLGLVVDVVVCLGFFGSQPNADSVVGVFNRRADVVFLKH